MIEAPDSALVANLHPSPNFEPRCNGARPNILILHYTGVASAERAIDWLSRPESRVSSHYVIDEAGRITQMVAEDMRAWHAGQSFWAGETDINSRSIGIEIQNPGHDLGYPEFPEAQMESVIELCRDIVDRYSILPERVLAHSDVAPRRKIDPGEKFDWPALARAGVGLAVKPVPPDPGEIGQGAGAGGFEIARAQELLQCFGYGLDMNGVIDEQTSYVLRAFQLHFRQDRVDGLLDSSTMATLERVIGAAGGAHLVT